MRLVLLLLLACGVELGLAIPGAAETAEVMASACRDVVSAPVRGDNVHLNTTFDVGRCWGAFAVVQEVTRLAVRQGSSERVFSVCSPAESTRTQLVAVFVQYVKQNPQRMHEEFFTVALDALRQGFPCGR